MQLFPTRPIDVILDLAGWVLVSFAVGSLLMPMPTGVALGYPVVAGDWYVAHGGPFSLTNHHNAVRDQRYGLDLVLVPAWPLANFERLGAHPSWGMQVVAPTAGVVKVGTPLGIVGNSGNTSEPHIHIHAMRRSREGLWKGVPMYIEGRALRRGHILRVTPRVR